LGLDQDVMVIEFSAALKGRFDYGFACFGRDGNKVVCPQEILLQ
jgi:hypothetical protein